MTKFRLPKSLFSHSQETRGKNGTFLNSLILYLFLKCITFSLLSFSLSHTFRHLTLCNTFCLYVPLLLTPAATINESMVRVFSPENDDIEILDSGRSITDVIDRKVKELGSQVSIRGIMQEYLCIKFFHFFYH